MKIAVITPSKLNRSALLEECKVSVLAQTRPADCHAIEVDVKAEGPAVVRNRLVKGLDSSFDWLAWLDDDDVLLPSHLEKLSAVAELADVVYSLCQMNCNTHAFSLEDLIHYNYIPVTALVRRSIFTAVGGFDEGPLEDWNLWKKIAISGGRYIFVPEVTWLYRVQGDSRNFVA